MQYEGAPSLSGLEQEHGPDAMRGASERVKMEEDDGPAEASTSTLRQVDIMDETDSSGMRPMPLQPLPAGYTLLALAMQFVRQAHALTPVLARRPTAHDNDQEQDEAGASSTIDLVANYRRLIDAALICCRAVVDQVEEQGGTVDMEGIKLQLRARAMLAELLVRETNATEETELHISRGLKTCTAHPALIDLRCRFYVLQVEFSLSDGNAKFAHNAVRRYIKEVSLLLSKSNPAIVAAHNLVSWMYHFYLLGVHIAHQLLHDYPAAVAHLKDMMQLAVQQEETILVWTLKTMAARLALINQDDNLASGLMLQLAAGFQLPTTDKQMAEQQETFVPPAGLSKNEVIALMHRTTHRDPWIQDKLPRILVMQFLVVLSLWQAYQGEMQVAKATVKRVHVLLDMPDSQPGEAEGWARVDITTTLVASSSPAIPLSSPWGAVKQASSLPPSSPTPAAATSPLSASYAPSSSPEKPYLHSMPQTAPATVPLFLATLPKQILYSYTFLVSTVVQLDPCGSSPKCLLYAMAGSNSFAAKLRGSEEEALPYGLSLPTIVSALQQVTRMQAEVMLVQIELYLMRSSLEQAEVVLTSLTALVKAHNLWTDYCGEILLIRGMIYHALGDLVNAFSHYHAGLLHSDPKSGTGLVCRASLLFIKIAHGYAVTTGMPDTNDKKEDGRSISPTSPVKGAYDEADGDELDPLYRAELAVLGKFAQALIDDCQNGTPSEQMLGLILVAFTHGELVRVKAYLSAALQQSNKVNSLYAKPLILALMATTFKYTQDDQSQKMMHSAHTICRSMGSHATEKAHKWGGDKEADEAGANDRASRKRKREKNIGPDSVGIVKLGLWTGQELLESYSAEGATERIKRQTLYNAAHETVLADQISTFGQRDRVKREQ